MRLLITGALGHIGSRIIHGLRPGDYDEVILLDNMLTQRYCSLFGLPEGVPFRFLEEDIRDAPLERYFRNIDVIVHLAAITDATRSFELAGEVEEVNFGGTERVAEACIECGCRLFFPSTTSVYGTQDALVDENCPVEALRPQSPYAESKLHAEQLLRSMGTADGLSFVVCRLGTIFGSSIGMRFHTAVNKFIWQACAGRPLTVWRTAFHQKRPYLDLSDAVRALRFIIERNAFDRETYNIVTENATVSEIIAIIRRYVPDLTVEYVESRIMNQLSYEVSCEKFKSLGFGFTGDLEQGIKESVELIRGLRQSSSV